MYFLQSDYYRFIHLSIFDIILVPLIVAVIMIWAYIHKTRKEEQQPIYRNYHWALLAKMISVILFCLAYMTFYGGDTCDYLNSTVALNNVLWNDAGAYLNLMWNGNQPEYYSYFTAEGGYPETHMWRDPQTFFVIRLFSPLVMISGGSFLISSLLMSLISYTGLWKFYRLLCRLYPALHKYFFFSALLIPSVLFWGSGLLKDSITITAALWVTYSIFRIFFQKKKILLNLIILVLMSVIILKIKPYILMSLTPGLLIWLFFNQVSRIRNKLLRILVTPFTLSVVFVLVAFLYVRFGTYLGVYGDIDSVASKIKITQEDLKREAAYGSNYYDIGTIEPSLWGLIKKTPQALTAGLFRPFLWEARNPFIVLSGLENLGILLLLLFVLVKTGPGNFLKAIMRDPFLTYSFVFVIMFALGVGLASANFGALVRYRIPLMPFMVSGLFILLDFYRKQKAAAKT